MADVKMPESIPCQFDKKGWTPCGKPSNNGWCSKHEGLKCVSCGKQATRSCDAEMGGLCCGSPLCDTCQHSREKQTHITGRLYKKELDEAREERATGKESKRKLALRGLPTNISLPAHLFELVTAAEWKNRFVPKVCYYLQLKHGLMGTFPAILENSRILVLSQDKESIIRVWRSLSPASSEIKEEIWMINEEVGVAYYWCSGDFEQKQSKPHKLFNKKEIEKLFDKKKNPFEWAPGLIGASISQKQFEELINKVAA